ncbi:lipid-binding SYLF domain-containing protein [Roseomonas sp. OT10]|uniref:lipid-binding SYLF domain-containing protein n=1 Tax=Roseomonas cutis TaxID=2897332 RepID=UPI001E648338|nr:lipid-binding SYLF domain-containing protein [Roseomonas sp. OT10]UFN48090.1 lipid-binding SYLF domain-containing protein [Roseomonas sp. OT10]
MHEDIATNVRPDLTRRALGGRLLPALALAGLAGAAALRPRRAEAATRAEIDAEVNAALLRLRGMDNARPLFGPAKAVLVFPRVISGGFIVGGQYGEGALLRGSTIVGYYNIAGASLGLLAGAQSAGLAMFFMTDAALNTLLNAADGWEIGTGPSVVVLDQGVQANVTATTLAEPVYAITFNQQGLMAALALNGTKITRINPG